MSIARNLPARSADNPVGNPLGATRVGAYGEGYNLALAGPYSKHNYADEGSYFIATNPTPGTALAGAVNASSDFTKSFFTIFNRGGAGGKRIYLDYIKIMPTVAPASGTSLQYAIQVDNINRLTSGGTTITPVNADPESSLSSNATFTAQSGAATIVTAAASASVRLVGRGVARSVIPAVLEEIVIQFGSSAGEGSSSATAAGRSVVVAAPVIIPGGYSAVVNFWFPSNAITGISYEFEAAWYER